MLNKGLPRDLLRVRPFVLDRTLKSFTHGEDAARIKIRREQQLDFFEHALQSGLNKPYTMIISGAPNDQKAKLIAAYLMGRAVQQKLAGARMGKTMPMWHWCSGSFSDKLRDAPDEHKPSMLILSNILADSTNVKIEKVRDLLEQFADIPRIIVGAGCTPLQLASDRLHVPIQYCLYVGQAISVLL